jgi:FOG: TPR repeat, SEL1 subfamily
MRHLLSCLLFACAGTANAQFQPPDPLPSTDQDLDVMQGGTAWLVGAHVEARRHFRAAAERGNPLGQYNLAMMLLYREGGACDAVQATALLRKSAEAGTSLARQALEQISAQQTARRGRRGAFPCPLPTQAHPIVNLRPS